MTQRVRSRCTLAGRSHGVIGLFHLSRSVMPDLLHAALTYQIIGAYFDVRNALPWGMHESTYANAMAIALRDRGVPFAREVPLEMHFRGERIGQFRADLIVELKSVERLTGAFEAQLINYLATAGLCVGLLLNFGLHGGRRRIVWTPRGQRMDVPAVDGRDTVLAEIDWNSTTDRN